MSEQEKIWILVDYIINKIHSCPLSDESNIDFEKECVGFGEVGCGECILRHLDKLDGSGAPGPPGGGKEEWEVRRR